MQVRSAGELHAGAALSIYDYGSPYSLENEVLREQLRLIAEEMDARVSTGGGQSVQGQASGHAVKSSHGQQGDSSAHSTPARRTHSGAGVVSLQVSVHLPMFIPALWGRGHARHAVHA